MLLRITKLKRQKCSAYLRAMEIIPCITTAQFEVIETLAREIIPEVYGPIVPADHIEYFLEKFQKVKTLQEQIEQGYEYFLLNDSGNEIGYLAIQPKEEIIYLSKLYLLASTRGKGFGKYAMEFVIKRANELNKPIIELIVNMHNTGSIEFYKKHGFEIIELQHNHFENGHIMPDYRMELKLRIQN